MAIDALFSKGRRGSSNKSNFESVQYKSKGASSILEYGESNPSVVTTDTSCNFNPNGKILFVVTLLQQLSRLLTTVSTLNWDFRVGERRSCRDVCLFVGCLTSQQHASVSQGRTCSDNLTCCHTEIEVADQTFHLTQSQYTDTGPTSPSANPITPGAWQGSHWSANF